MKAKKFKKKLGRQSNEVSERTKKKIIMASLKIFAQEGFFNAKLRDIAALAGTTHSLIRHHFGSKEDLWKAVVDYGTSMHADRLRQIINESGLIDPVEILKKFIKTYITATVRNTELSKILLHDNSRTSPHLDYLWEKQKETNDVARPIFKRVQAKGYFKDFNNESFTVYVRALVETPIATWDLTNKMFEYDIRSEKGITLHTERVINFLFKKD
ncbi:MAG: TetR/AcrR family transcriptional regulator [Spirochaetes bacterium]|nr:TetR/AcrR family transcriptional regulator [Spirochaetota bacterium]